ncbi:MAG: phosphoribosyltransferase [Candidatus Woesearchaeota archaeon]
MGRNILHCIQSHVFSKLDHFHFLDWNDARVLVDSLTENVCAMNYKPDLIIGISSGGDYPAELMSERLGVEHTTMDVSHYSLSVFGLEVDEIIGMYRVATLMGHKPRTRLVRTVSPEYVFDKNILLIDDDAYSGKTLDIAINELMRAHPADIRTGVLQTHDTNKHVDFSGEKFPKHEYYKQKFRFPWSKISPYYNKHGAQQRQRSNKPSSVNVDVIY